MTLNHSAQLALVVLCFHNFRLQSCVIKQTTVQSMRSERGLNTTLHCLQWYKLVLHTRLSMQQYKMITIKEYCRITYPIHHRGTTHLSDSRLDLDQTGLPIYTVILVNLAMICWLHCLTAVHCGTHD